MRKWAVILLALKVMVTAILALPVQPAEPDNSIAHNRTLRDIECYEDEYLYRGNCCRFCPAGTSVSEHCIMNHARGSCEPCTPGRGFTAFPNGLESCVSCYTCREDQVLVQECTPKSNTLCQCIPGFYCIPGEPCEACTRCSRCPKGQRVKDPCTATTDTVCDDISIPEPTSSTDHINPPEMDSPVDAVGFKSGTTRKDLEKMNKDSDAGNQESRAGRDLFRVILTGAAFAAVAAIGLSLSVWFMPKRLTGKKTRINSKDTPLIESTDPSADSSVNSTPRFIRSDLERAAQDPAGVHLNAREPGSVGTETETPRGAASNPGGDQDPEPTGDDEDGEDSGPCTAPCSTCDQPPLCDCQWSDCIHSILDHVGVDTIVRLVRQLHVNNNHIERIIRENPFNCYEQNFKLLNYWRNQNGKQACMSTVLRLLEEIETVDCYENIVNGLRSKNIHINAPKKRLIPSRFSADL